MSSSLAPPTGWRHLSQELINEGRDAEAVAELLSGLRQAGDLAGVALYLQDGTGHELDHAIGDGEFPRILSGDLPAHFGALRCGGSLILLHPLREAAETQALFDRAELAALALLGRARRSDRQLRRRQFEARFRGVEQQALYDVGLAITSTLHLDALTESILTWALGLLDARRAALYLLEGGVFRLSRALGGDARTELPACAVDALPEDILPDARYLLAAGIEIEGKPRGLLVVADKESRRGVGPFAESDRSTLDLFANQAAIALENARLHRQALEKERLEREMELAAEIQRLILPKEAPKVPGYDLLGWNRPARHVGGDYYDFLPFDENRLVITLGDVSGKGVPAALMVSILHSALRLMLDRREFGTAMFERLNRHVYESSAPNRFITLFSADLDVSSGQFSYLNAGHNPCFVLDREGVARELPSSGVPIGLLPHASYQVGSIDLRPGDLVCLYSDGITEASDLAGEEYTLGRLVSVLRERRDRPLEEILGAIDAEVSSFAAGLPQGDDQTVVLVRCLPS